MSTSKTTNQKGWNINTDLCMDLKTFLRTDRTTQLGKDYAGLLTRDGEDHYSFVETMPWTNKRNPYVRLAVSELPTPEDGCRVQRQLLCLRGVS